MSSLLYARAAPLATTTTLWIPAPQLPAVVYDPLARMSALEMWQHANMLNIHGQYKEAAWTITRYFDRAMESRPPKLDVLAWESRAVAYVMMGDYQNALYNLNCAIAKSDPAQPHQLRARASVFDRLGRAADASKDRAVCATLTSSTSNNSSSTDHKHQNTSPALIESLSKQLKVTESRVLAARDSLQTTALSEWTTLHVAVWMCTSDAAGGSGVGITSAISAYNNGLNGATLQTMMTDCGIENILSDLGVQRSDSEYSRLSSAIPQLVSMHE